MVETTEQIIIEQPNEMVKFDEVKALLIKYKAENETLDFDYKDKQGAKDAKSHIAKLRKGKTMVSNIHKEIKADALAFGRKVDAKKNEYTAEFDKMIKFHKDPLDAIDAEIVAQATAKIEAKKAEEARIEAEKQAELDKREAEIRAKEQEIWEAEDKLRREQEELNRKQREAEIAKTAAEQAKKQAEAEAKAKANAKELAAKKHKEACEANEKKRIENVKHRQEVEDKILKSLLFLGPPLSFKMLNALKDNKIPNVTINY